MIGKAVGITILLILSGLFVNVAAVQIQDINFSKPTNTPRIHSQNILNNGNQIENNNHPKNYDILIWRINKGKVDKETVVSMLKESKHQGGVGNLQLDALMDKTLEEREFLKRAMHKTALQKHY